MVGYFNLLWPVEFLL